MIGKTLSHYEVLEEISRGGMGIVYRALDVRLNREVALKVLPPELVADGERKRRFVQEAQAAAALKHPNIAVVYEIDDVDDLTFIAMELIDGEKLSDAVKHARLTGLRVLEIALAIAEGLAVAHDKGVIHRDLKPDNIMITEDGHPKIIDFGLAKLVEPLDPGGGKRDGVDSKVATIVRGKTDTGVVMGTVSYMSPEQGRAQAIDHRSDIFTLGIVLYEMLAGELPFRGPSAPETLSAIITEPTPVLPGLDEVSDDGALQRVLEKCLEKDPDDRYQTAKDLVVDLRWLIHKSDSRAKAGDSLPSVRQTLTWRAAGLALAALLPVALLLYLLLPRNESLPRFINAVQVTSAVGIENYPAWSPDSGRLAYESNQSGNWDIWVTQLGASEPVNLTAGQAGQDRYPSWSPDGRQIAFLSQRDQTWGLYTMSALGGRPFKVVSLPIEGFYHKGAPQWSADGTEIAVPVWDPPRSFAEIVSLRTNETRRVPLPQHEGTRLFDLSWSPDGRMFAYVNAIFYTAEITQLWVVPYSGGDPISVTTGRTNDWNPTWSEDGRKLFFVSNQGGSMDLWQQPIGGDGKPDGDAVPITAGLGMRSAAFSPDGARLAYSRGRLVSNVWRIPILRDRLATWADARQLTFDNAFAEFIDVSSDGTLLAINSDRGGNQDLWIMPTEGGELLPLAPDPTPDWAPRWSPNGQDVVFYSYRSGNREVWVMPAEGGSSRQLTSHPAEDAVPTWSPDGREIAFISGRSGNRDVWVVGVDGGEPRQVTVDPSDADYPVWSPDGQSLVFQSSRTGEPRLFLIPAEGGEAKLLSGGPGLMARWSPDGKVLYFSGDDERAGNLWALSPDDGSEYPVTDLVGRNGTLGYGLATDGHYLYFTWWEDLGDLWVMGVVEQ